MVSLNTSPQDFSFSKKSHQQLVKYPGEIAGSVFYLQDLEDCQVYLLDTSSAVYIDNLRNCKVCIGPVKESVVLRHCSSCTLSVATSKLKLKECHSLTVFLYTPQAPSMESCTDVRLAPYNFAYAGQDIDFVKVQFDLSINMWSQVEDCSRTTDSSNYELLQPKLYREEVFEAEGLGEPVNPVLRSVHYGGTLREEVIPRTPPPRAMPLEIDRKDLPAPEISWVLTPNPQEQVVKEEIPPYDKNLLYYYRHPFGFLPVAHYRLHGFSDVVQGSISRLNQLVHSYNEQRKELNIASLVVLLCLFLIGLFCLFLKIVAGFLVAGQVFLAIVIVGSFLVIQGIIFIKRKRIIDEGEQAVLNFMNEENSKKYEQRRATLRATLDDVRIDIN